MAKKNGNAAEALATVETVPAEVVQWEQASFDDLAGSAARVEGLEVVEKESLVGREFLVVDAKINEQGKFGSFVSLTIMFRDKTRAVINDGSTGIYKQLQEMSEKAGGMLPLPIYCKNGLRKRSYESAHGPATTYYLSH